MEGDSVTSEMFTATISITVNEPFTLRAGSIIALILLPILTLCGLLGNLLVVISVFKFKQLRIVPNFFIVSLAVADLLVCMVVMPLALYQDINNGNWGLPPWLCDVWVSLDVLMSTASIWNLCVISLDRFLAITRPHQYARRRTAFTVLFAVLTTWLLAAFLSIPTLLFVGGHDPTQTSTCVINVTPTFVIISSCVAFYIPCAIVLVLYWRILVAARRHVLHRRRVDPGIGSTSREDATASTAIDDGTTNDQRFGENQPAENTNPQRKIISVTRERKAALVLAIVVGIFICCWLPFFLVFVSLGICPQCHISITAIVIVTWLGWCNSILNPIIYTIFNKEFRTAFRKIMTCTMK
ncbi:probable G-protein coupled receptor No18 [Amphiura filiformis]|uniref:probable G-protein coupled receptor No18 n=1 Tax=Amphiura filiformis TaxID=82378 RepID=UPI003B2217FD